MGFLERLRQQREQEKQQAMEEHRLQEENASEAARLAQISREKKLQTEREEQERLKKDIIKAQEYFSKSDFLELVGDLASIEGNMLLRNGIVKPDAFWFHMLVSYGGQEYLHLDERDQFSSVGLSLIWEEGNYSWKHKDRYGSVDYTVYEDTYSFITVGCDQFGTITLRKRWGDIKLPVSKWLGRTDIQEKALEEAFGNPKNIVYRHDSRPPSQEPIRNR